MADKKQTRLSIIIRAVDQATAKINAINERLDKATKPIRDFQKALGDLREKSGLDQVIDGFKGVGSAIAGILSKIALIGGAIGAAVLGVKSLIDELDNLGDVAERVGLTADALAQLRYAAARSGVEVQKLDRGLENFSKQLGQLSAGTGGLASFLKRVSPALLKQVKAAKSNEEAFNLLAGAMAKLEDPAKRAALAQQAFGDASIALLLAKGPKGIQELRDRYAELAGPQAGAVAAAGDFGDSMDDLKAATDGVKAALVEGLAPALKVLVERLREFFKENRGRIKEWAADLGKKLPGAVMKLVDIFKGVVDAVKPFVNSATKLKIIAAALAAVIVGPLISSIVSLGIAIMSTPVGWIVGGIALIAAGAYELIKHWDDIADFFVGLWDTVKGAFGAFFGWVKNAFLNYTPLGLIIKHWQPIADFFTDLWDGITGVFRKAWEFIKGIVDKVADAVKFVADKAGKLGFGGAAGSYLNNVQSQIAAKTARPVSDVTAQVAANLQAIRANATQAKVTIDIANAPRGTRVRTDPQSTADVDLSVGYQMLPGGAL